MKHSLRTIFQLQRRPHPHAPRPRAAQRSRSRSAFTLIELIVVILVIGILAAILLPAIGNVRATARNAQVTVDIKNLEAAIAAFKLKFGMEPPSSFLIGSENVHYTGSDIGKSSIAIMRELWPSYVPREADSNLPGQVLGISGPQYLNGAECLAFFLGGPGMYTASGSSTDLLPNGFSSNPLSPFFQSGSSRVGPFLEIDTAKLVDVDGDGFYEILDTLPNQTMPYQYLSSYNGRGYKPFGADGNPGTADDEVITISGTPKMFSAYLKKDGNWADASKAPSGVNNAAYWNGKSYQIISPGLDGEYGVGGEYSTENGLKIKADNADTFRSKEKRNAEIDNITNFSSGPFGKTAP